MAYILVVDDDPATCRALTGLLRLEGHTVRAAKDGHEALRAIAEQRPELVVLDMMMPALDGLALLTVMRADPALAAVRVVVYSAVDDALRREQARRLDAHAYVIKGSGWPLLREQITRALDRHFPDAGTGGSCASAG
ncbi:MAG: chemotaxis protein CheY [Phycisphaerales bacterium]|nr:chemotaxis protein CheY [Phycisphaerales bacterium]MDB5303420.1 chemotaxis protein CheY [Phycisphaerales bacterium]